MNDDKEAIQSQLDAIENPGGSKHEAWLKKDPAVLAERENCYRQMFPDPIDQPPPPPAVSVTTSQTPATPTPPVDGTPDDAQVCEDHLKSIWPGDSYEANRQAAFRTRDFIFDARDPADSALFDKVMDVAGNDPRLFQLLAKKADQIPTDSVPAVDISDVPQQRRIEMADAVAAFFLGGPAQGRLADNQLLRQIRESVGDDQLLINHAAKLHRKIFGKGESKLWIKG